MTAELTAEAVYSSAGLLAAIPLEVQMDDKPKRGPGRPSSNSKGPKQMLSGLLVNPGVKEQLAWLAGHWDISRGDVLSKLIASAYAHEHGKKKGADPEGPTP